MLCLWRFSRPLLSLVSFPFRRWTSVVDNPPVVSQWEENCPFGSSCSELRDNAPSPRSRRIYRSRWTVQSVPSRESDGRETASAWRMAKRTDRPATRTACHRNAVPNDSNQQKNASFYDRSTALATAVARSAADCCFGPMPMKHTCQDWTSLEAVGNRSSALTWGMAVEGDRESCCSARCLHGEKREDAEKGRTREKYSRHNRIIVLTVISRFFSDWNFQGELVLEKNVSRKIVPSNLHICRRPWNWPSTLRVWQTEKYLASALCAARSDSIGHRRRTATVRWFTERRERECCTYGIAECQQKRRLPDVFSVCSGVVSSFFASSMLIGNWISMMMMMASEWRFQCRRATVR